MKALLTIARKDLKLLTRNRASFFWVLGFPVLVALLFGAAFSGGGGRPSLPVAVVDLDRTDYSRALVRRLETLKAMQRMESNRQDGAPAPVRESLAAVLSVLEEQIASVERQIKEHIDRHPDLKAQSDLLESIPGIGAATAAMLLSELGPIRLFGSARQAAAFVGLVPRLVESGTSVRARSSLCKMGRSRLRRALYFPALSALRFNPAIRAMAERLSRAGKSKMAIVGAAMRKLVHLAFGVLKSGRPFDPFLGISPATP